MAQNVPGTGKVTDSIPRLPVPGATLISFGYGTQRKSDVTGAVATLTPENFNQGAIFNPVDQLVGKIAGLTITEPGGDPNQTASVQLRGQSSLLGNLSPLFVVDGVILDNAAQFQNIPPDDIASYDVLKDASAAAIYGIRGANGVIIVTTKKGVAGRPTISYDGLVGSSVQSKYYDLLTPNEYRAAISTFALSTYDKGANTDWQKAIGRTAYQQRHYVSLSGGSNMLTYMASANYQNQQGIIQNNSKEQLGLRFSGELKAIGDKLDIKAGVQYVNTTRKFIDYSNFSFIYSSPPTFPVKNPDGSYYTYSDFDEANPVEHINEETLGAKDHLTLINGSADYSITHDLKIGVLGSASLNKIESNGYVPTFPLEGNPALSATANENRHSYTGNIHINYDKTFGKSTLNLLGAYEYNDHTYNMDYSSGPAFATATGFLKMEYKQKSFIGRAAYNYDDRFYATATLREDGPGVFNNTHGSFPSLSLAYRFKKDILASADWITDIKLRAGYGVTGNSTDQNGNPLFQWEKRQGRNIGLDFSLFNGRISGDVNYFNDLSKNLLFPYTVPTPPFVTNTVLANLGSLANKGFEVSLSGRIISGHKLNWTANGQIAFISTTVNSLSGQYTYNGQTYTLTPTQIPVGYAQGRGLSSNPIEFLKPGYGLFVFNLPHYTGVDAQGNQTFDGQTIQQNPNPAGHYIDPSPKFNYGITNSFDYGNWNFNFALRGVYGQKAFDNTLLNVETTTRLPQNNVTKEALTNGIKDAPVASDKWLEGASYLRMDNMTLGYSFKRVAFASSLRVFVAANNLFVITGYKGLDPEVRTQNGYSNSNILFGANTNGSKNQPYIDNNYAGEAYYPWARTFSLGVNVSLK
ncbi:MAG TPA: TonB-dependent receptor [Mucilaginibacter sp.]|nr:TonB-dependent receptor [Mucilaginibacter sp.]